MTKGRCTCLTIAPSNGQHSTTEQEFAVWVLPPWGREGGGYVHVKPINFNIFALCGKKSWETI